jgi:hypothetical protein
LAFTSFDSRFYQPFDECVATGAKLHLRFGTDVEPHQQGRGCLLTAASFDLVVF